MSTLEQRENAKESESVVSDFSSNGPGLTTAHETRSRETERSGPSGPADYETSPSSLALKPTGPRTPAGKQKSRYNAVKRGIFAKAILLEGESRPEYESLVKGFREALQPQGRLETELVENLAALQWRKRRVLKAENAEIANAAEFKSFDFSATQELTAWDHSRAGESSGGMMRHISNPLVLQEAIETLTMFRDNFEKFGFQEGKDPWLLRKLYGLDHDGAAPLGIFHTYQVYSKLAAEAPEENEKAHSPEELKKDMLKMLDWELLRLEFREEVERAADERRRHLQTIAALVPSQDVSERLIRSEAHLSREFDRTLSQLERLQRKRLGQPVLPPLRVELSK